MASSSKVLAMFPGQGSQYVGMGRQLLQEFPVVRPVFEEAEDAAKFALRRVCFDGPEDELRLTANTQPCILTVSVAVWRVLQAETGFKPAYFAGHSLGEYAALVAAGKLSFGRAAFLVRRRGEAMQEAVPPGVGAMAAVVNATAEDLQKRCRTLSREGSVVEVVNFNSPQQLVVAGHKTAVDRLGVDLETVTGVRFVLLPVSAPFHSSLMSPAREAMTPLLQDTAYKNTHEPVIANLTAKPEPDYDSRFLIEQINSPVLWTQSLLAAHQHGCDTFLEIGPGKVLFGLARKTLPRDAEAKLMHTEDMPATIEALKLA